MIGPDTFIVALSATQVRTVAMLAVAQLLVATAAL